MNKTTVFVVMMGCLVFGQAYAGAQAKSVNLSNLCFVDGLKFTTVQSAVSACGAEGTVVIPPNYAGTESAGGAGGAILDFRHRERPEGLTPITEFGAKADAEMGTDGASESGSSTFYSSTADFVPARDTGKTIVITGAGPENASLTTTIAGVQGPRRVTLSVAAGFTATGLSFWYGTDNTHALDTAYHSGKPLFLPPGKYLMAGTVKCTTPLFLTGSGDQSVLVNDSTVFQVGGTRGHFIDNFRMQAATRLTVVRPNQFPTPHAGTPVAVDRIGAGIGYQPEPQDGEVWTKSSKQQQSQDIGPKIIASSDQTHIYRITGDLVSILLFDVQYSEVSMCDFRAGRNWVGGIVLWHTPKDGRVNRQDMISYNTVRYASFNGIAWAASERVSILHNVTEFNGESGIKNYSSQSDGTHNTYIQILDNRTQRNHFDGFDLSEDYPHANSFRAFSVASRNLSIGNDRTGTYADGLGWTITGNTFEDNGLSGMSMDVSDSVISGNTVRNNNRLHDRFSHQMLLGPGRPSQNNTIENNLIEGNAESGAAIHWSPQSTGNKLHENAASGGASFSFGVPPAETRGNSESRGRYPDR